jgi:hypothetical protein
LGGPSELDLRIDGKLVHRFTVGGRHMEGEAPLGYAGNVPGSDQWEEYVLHADADLQHRVTVPAGQRVVSVSFVKQPREAEGVLQPPQSGYALAVDETRSSPTGVGGPAIDSVAVDGPYNPAGRGDTLSRRKIFVCRPAGPRDESDCAEKILTNLARRAYRRPVTDAEMRTLLDFYQAGREQGDFDSGIQHALERVLVDPSFLFRTEQPPASGHANYRISDIELASSLSFFLWSSIPDDALLEAAIGSKLRDPEVLQQQVRRMLGDRRSDALVDNFVSQWLAIRGLSSASPNPDLFPDFDDNLRDALWQETKLFVASQIRDDRSIVELLTADYTFLNERLARHYGVPGVYGNRFRRVTLAGSERRGLFGHGSVLIATSYGNRTSPVLRGHWVLENILGTPPPPPPADVPGLVERGADGKPRSVRESLEQHRKNPACTTCHAPMDPLGFALENFDAIGKWRVIGEGDTAIDATAVMPNGSKFHGPAGLQDYVIARKEQFVDTFTEKLLSYALGRQVEYYDRPAIRKIRRDAAAQNYRWSSIFLGIVNSVPFQTRRSHQ